MGMACSICNHSRRLAIDREIVEGKSHTGIARRFGLSSSSVDHHARAHLSRQLVQSFAQRQSVENMGLLARIDTILTRAEAIFKRNYRAKHDVTALKALSESRATIELLTRIAVHLHEARAAELASNAGSYEVRREEEEREFIAMALDRLNPAEQVLWQQLLLKIHGQTTEDVVPDTSPRWATPDPVLQVSPAHSLPAAAARPRRTRFPQDRLKVRPVPPVPIPDGSDLAPDQRNPLPGAARDVRVHRIK
jgi:hypothetical protein